MSRIILIVGPTATGKTAASIAIAKSLNAKIINTDSCAMYKECLIGTAKVTKEEMDNIPHYFIDNISVDEEYTIFDYQKEGRKILDELIVKNENIVIVGGSGLYIKALLYNYNLTETQTKRVDYSKYTNQELKSIADDIDKNNNIHVNNRQRLERYITYFNETGSTISKTSDINKPIYDFEIIGLNAQRDILYERIDKRVDKMMDMGLLDEVSSLYKQGLKNIKNIIGYKELIEYFEGNVSLEDAVSNIKKDTRHYAKRQLTWYNHQFNNIKWFNTDYDNFNNTIIEIKKHLNIN